MTTRDELKNSIRSDLQKELIETTGMDTVVIDGEIPENLMQEIKETGIALTGAGKCGKTTFARVINRELNKQNGVQIKVFDTALNWIKDFEPIWYQTLSEKDMLTAGTEVYFEDDSIIFECSDFTSTEAIRETISQIVGIDYELHRRYKLNDVLDNNIVYTIEEAQNILSVIGKYSRWNTYISQGRNMNLSFIFITRRMADISAKARENVPSYMWGRATGDNERKRIRRISNDTVFKLVPTLGLGEFVYWNGTDATLIKNRDIYKSESKPVKWNG